MKSWFKRGAYPTAAQFSEWLDSFWHVTDKIPVSGIDGLADRLNDKFAQSDGEDLERRQGSLEEAFTQHENQNQQQFDSVTDRLTGLRTGLDEEAARAEGAETELGGRIDGVEADLMETREIAEGASRGLSFDTKQNLDDWFAGTFVRADGKLPADLHVGDNLLIAEPDTPDYWWDGEKLVILENEKIDLTDYLQKPQAELLYASKTALADEIARAKLAEKALADVALYPSGQWNSGAVPYRANALVKLGGYMFRALRETSVPPAGLLTSGGDYLLSGGGYVLAGSPEEVLNAEDWEVFAIVSRSALTQTRITGAEQITLPAVYSGSSLTICNPTADTVTTVSTEDGSTIGGTASSSLNVTNALVEFRAIQVNGAIKWFVKP